MRRSWQENEDLYEATAHHFIALGMPEVMAKTAAYVVATDSNSGTQENPTERTSEQQEAVWLAWNWLNEHGKLDNQQPEIITEFTEYIAAEDGTMMTKPLGYYTNYTPGDGGLLGEMEDAWGSQFQELKDNERLWMIARIANNLWMTIEFEDEDIRDDCEEAAERAVRELSSADVLGLIETLLNQVKFSH